MILLRVVTKYDSGNCLRRFEGKYFAHPQSISKNNGQEIFCTGNGGQISDCAITLGMRLKILETREGRNGTAAEDESLKYSCRYSNICYSPCVPDFLFLSFPIKII
jgi:hypothetical protein